MASIKLKPKIPVINWINPLTKGLIFDMPFFERSGNPNDIARKYSGTNTSGTWNTGPIGSHLILGGTPANVSFNSPITTTAGQPISIQAVFSFTSSTNGTVIGIRNGSSASKWTAMRANGNGAGQVNFLHDALGSGANVDSATTTFNDGLVHNAVGVYDGNFILLYVDGKFEATSISKPNAALNETGTWRIGRRSDLAVEYVTGKIYVARIWNRGLNSNEIKLLNIDPWIIYRKSYSYLFKNISSFSATGGTITQSGGYKIHTFTSNGTFTVTGNGTVDALVVAGGGGGAAGGGGGGGYQYQSSFAVTEQAYSITVGAGGTKGDGYAGSVVPTAGSNSVFSTITATGGGKGGTNFADVITNGGNGGSGGGGAYSGAGATTGGTGSQGNNGGTNGSQGAPFPAGGGGGAGAVGQNAPDTTHGGAGGAGTANSISGTSVTYAGGGGGGVYGAGTGGAGGVGGGGTGGTSAGNGTNGTANTGGGGGGTGNGGGLQGGDGGSGIVIIRYLNPLVSGRASMQSRANFLNLQRL